MSHLVYITLYGETDGVILSRLDCTHNTLDLLVLVAGILYILRTLSDVFIFNLGLRYEGLFWGRYVLKGIELLGKVKACKLCIYVSSSPLYAFICFSCHTSRGRPVAVLVGTGDVRVIIRLGRRTDWLSTVRSTWLQPWMGHPLASPAAPSPL